MELQETLYRVFIQGDAWHTILEGIGVTVQISLLSLALGTILGAAVCFLRMKGGAGGALARAYIAVLRGSPVLMLLMLLYYGFLAGSGFSPLTVAVAAFSLHTAAHVAELFRSSLMALSKGEVEAARTLGFSRRQAFFYVTLPQLAHLAKPVYQSTVVNLIQWTSVVGYVTITDLTRVMSNIASRTMQPLLVMTVGMLIYIGMAYLVYGLFALTDRKQGGESS